MTGHQSKQEEGFFKTREGHRLFYQSWKTAECKAGIIITHGYFEHSGRYTHVGEYLAGQGYDVHIYDCRGHGQSGGRRGHIRAFNNYLEDLELFIELIRGQRGASDNLLLLGHSNGGLISLAYAIKNQDSLKGLMVTGPYLGLKAKVAPHKKLLGRMISNIWGSLALEANLNASYLTHDEEMVRAYEQDPLVNTKATARWYTETLAAQNWVISNAPRLSLACLIMQGEDDQIVDPLATRKVFDSLGSRKKTWISYPGMYHEIINEIDRERVLSDMVEWLDGRFSADKKGASSKN